MGNREWWTRKVISSLPLPTPFSLPHLQTHLSIRLRPHAAKLRPDVAAQVNEIATAIVSPRRWRRGRTFIGSLRLFISIAHRLDAARIETEADHEIPDRARPAIAEAKIILRCAARVTVAFDAEGDRAVALDVEPIGQRAQLILLRLEEVGFVIVEKDRPCPLAELFCGRRLCRHRRGRHR